MIGEIIGLDISEYPRFYKSINRVMMLYHFKKMLVDLHEENFQGRRIVLAARFAYKKGRRTVFIKNLVTTRPTVEFIENNLSDDEIDSLIGHEFGHMKNHDGLKLVFPTVLPIIIGAIGAYLILFYISGGNHNWTGCLIADFYIAIVIIIILLIALYIALYPLNILYLIFIYPKMSRKYELRADRESVHHVKKPDALKSALVKYIEMAANNNQNKTVDVKLMDKILKIFFKDRIYLELAPPLELRLKRIDEYRVN